MSSKVAKIVSTAAYGNDRVVKIEVPCFEALLNYKPGTDEITVVVASEPCPEEDLRAIKAHCQQFDYSYEDRVQAPGGCGESSTNTTKDTAACSTGEIEKKGKGKYRGQWNEQGKPLKCSF